jgi:hypothetical protein
MRGKVEVFAITKDGTSELIASEDNLVVDGAGESIVDMLTIPATTLGIEPRVMDTSNWRVTAISFGTANKNFGNNPVYAGTSCTDIPPPLVGATAYYVTSEAINDPSSWVNPDRTVDGNQVIRALWVPASIPGSDEGSYEPPIYLPSYPDPLDTRLEPGNSAYVNVSADGAVSFGQFENRLAWNVSGENAASGYVVGAYCASCNVGTGGSMDIIVAGVSSLEGDFRNEPGLNVVCSAGGIGSVRGYNGMWNYNYDNQGNVDARGFIRCPTFSEANDIYRSWPDSGTDKWAGLAWLSGVGEIPHGQVIPFVPDPRIEITTKLHYDDISMFNMFGGLHHIGLWTPNVKESMKNSPPPWGWYPTTTEGANDIEYRLFAKKTFTENLCSRKDKNSVNPGIKSPVYLTIKWTIDLRSKHD